MLKQISNIGGLNLYVNPLDTPDGQLIQSVNLDSYPFGAKSKRGGYTQHLGTANGSPVQSLFSWTKDDGSLFLYRKSGDKLYYSTQGTADWAVCGNGTMDANSHVGYEVLSNTLIIGDGVGSTRHTTNGTAFTNTTLAPVGEHFAEYQNRVYLGGTASTLFYSTTNDLTNWNTGGTSDSSSFTIPGAQSINKVIKCSDRIVASKASGIINRWDGYNRTDMSTNLGPSSPYSVDQTEGYYFWLNRLGIFSYGGDRPKLISNAIQSQIYNQLGQGIAGSVFDTAPGEIFRYDYLLSAGTITDDLSSEQIPNAIIKYNYQKNEFLNYRFANFPKAMHSYTDITRNSKMIFGDSSGQCYLFGGSETSDNGVAIDCTMQYVVHFNTLQPKNWNNFQAIFNPGCQARVQVACSNSFDPASKRWQDLGDIKNGVAEWRFKQGSSESTFLFIRISESSKNARLTLYGFEVDGDIKTRK